MKKLHIGCGPIYLDGWTNIDTAEAYRTDICENILTMDFKDVDVIYSCHMAEHLRYPDEMIKFLELCYKWLKSDGILRLAVPDLQKATTAYTMGVNLNFLYGGDFKAYYHKDTSAERLNFFVKAWGHQMCYDFELLSSLFSDAGFRDIKKMQPNESLIENFSHDRFISESLYIEAQK